MGWKFVKKLTEEGFAEFCDTHFSQGYFVRGTNVPTILTSSEVLKSKTEVIDFRSGTSIGIGFDLYRYDSKDEVKTGLPINVDKYFVTDGSLCMLIPPFQGHHQKNVPEFTQVMPVVCGKCRTVFEAGASLKDIPLFNKVKRHSWYHATCPICSRQNDIARINNHGQYLALQG